jgi:hypothetical protein
MMNKTNELYSLYESQANINVKNRIWVRVKFTLFSMLVSSSFFAAYNIMSFYTGVVVLLGSSVRVALIFNTFMGW